MKDFSKGKIYKVISNNNNKVYIGSTIQRLCKRMSGHREKKHNNCSSSLLGDIKDCYIILICNYPCNNNDQLRMEEERHYQLYKKNGFDVVNKQSPYISKEQKKEYINKYYEEHKEQSKKYYEYNKEKNKDKKKKYREEHKEHYKELHKKYYEDNKDKLKKHYEDNKEKMTCICGCIILKRCKIQHEKSKKHIEYINETV